MLEFIMDGFEIFKPTIDQARSGYIKRIDEILRPLDMDTAINQPDSATLLEALEGSYQDVVNPKKHRTEVLTYLLNNGRVGVVLLDGQGVVTPKGADVLIPSIFHCTAIIIELSDGQRISYHSNDQYYPEMIFTLLKEDKRIGNQIKEIKFLTNKDWHGKPINELAKRIAESTGVPVRGFEISELFSMGKQLQSGTLFIHEDNVLLLRFSQDQRDYNYEKNEDWDILNDPMDDLQQVPRDQISASIA